MFERPATQHFILVVDDDPVASQSISNFIHGKGYNVIVCNNLEEAFFELSQNEVDLILANYLQTDGTALMLLAHLEKAEKEIPVIVINEKKESQAILDCFKMGVLDFVIKPINVELFWYKAECLLSRVQLQDKVKQQRVELEEMLYEKAREEQMARHLFEHLVNIDNVNFDFIRTFCQASANFSGDIILNGISPNGNLFLMLADSTGHGLSAAMPIMRVASTFRAMVSKDFSLVALLSELNEKVYRENPGDRFIACIILEADFHRKKLYIWNGGMPPVYMQGHCNDASSPQAECNDRFHSTNMALGILPPYTFIADIFTIDFPEQGYACLFSDGLIDQHTIYGTPFGITHLRSLFKEHEGELTQFLKDNLNQYFSDQNIADDITVCTLDFKMLNAWHHRRDLSLLKSSLDGEFSWDVKISGPMLLKADYLSTLNQFLSTFGFATNFCQKAFTVVAELFNNALDHGVLKLDSRLKNDPDGFELYHSIRESNSERLTAEDWVKVNITWCSTKELHICVADSGTGFKEQEASSDYPELSGRGLSLVKALCKDYELISPGNITKVIME
ncbi:fused response regulator/phosphatase [Shewanella sp. HN-41]|uniref:fused response regulator/phosphatase n=1 Tax=Shewanella sp. HN-41 TaxID=327275 RepID=UPI00021257EA|nr:fused response regulator/phosphatase [Shewanella sp. HN-41]EGM70015.1 che cluster two-component response regulator [Shewanella sp. HN-41]